MQQTPKLKDMEIMILTIAGMILLLIILVIRPYVVENMRLRKQLEVEQEANRKEVNELLNGINGISRPWSGRGIKRPYPTLKNNMKRK